MESELKDLNSKPAKPVADDGSGKPAHDDASGKDDRPLLKPDPAPQVSNEELQELEKKCAAYVRRDAYGTMGRGELTVKEKVLLGLALVTLAPIRVVLAMTILVIYYLICRICTLFSVPNRDEEQEDYAHMGGWRRAVIVQCGRSLSRLMLFILGFYWINETYRIPSDAQPKPTADVLSLFHTTHTNKIYL
ncbi:lysophospholipid acyltransferase LPEAT1 isoform X2 [Prunus yedoensis var. nudiflora]|uniref:Lysophospholipid acyltransferase LPEAT1 isoform X2 n=1 Tax=Prunus yedoensis var. nudiflora TaxID=2094558 RepID=A0A314Z9Y6_PRUYE|nr:lysophospholipid acyltransferase LPEAT1 isoform X2 [Prunus yedoensis var. nudiflora]